MPILNTRDVRATRFESSASNDTEMNIFTEMNILKGPFVNISRIVGISRAYSLHKCISMTNPLPRDLKACLSRQVETGHICYGNQRKAATSCLIPTDTLSFIKCGIHAGTVAEMQ